MNQGDQDAWYENQSSRLCLIFNGVFAMIRKVIKIALWGTGVVFVLVVALFVALLVGWDDGSSARINSDRLIEQSTSPDGRVVAELHKHTSAMWGGPDTLYIAIGQSDRTERNKVYSRTYECADYSAFGLEWETPRQLTIRYGECNPSQFAHTPAENAKENKVWQQDTSWNGTTIRYDDAHQEATR
jgi:hypothetical protein